MTNRSARDWSTSSDRSRLATTIARHRRWEIIPGTTVYSVFGAGLGRVFDAGGEVNLKAVFSPPLIAALVGLAVLSLLPIALRRLREHRQ